MSELFDLANSTQLGSFDIEGRGFGFDMSIPPPIFVDTESEAKLWMERYSKSWVQNNGLGIDSETTGLKRHRDIVLIWSMSDGQSRICMDAKMLQIFQPLLEDPTIPFDFTNAAYDMHMFANVGIDLSKSREQRCTIVQSWLINENNQGRHGLKEATFDNFGRHSPTFEMTFGKKPPKRKGHPEVTEGDLIRLAMSHPASKQKAVDYASLDAYNSTMLRAHFDNKMRNIVLYPGMTLFDYYYMVEVPFTKLLWTLERRGFCVDADYFSKLKPGMEQEMLEIEKEFAKQAGQPVNLESPLQVREFFFKIIGKQPTKFTDGGTKGIKQPSVDAEVLEEWAGDGDYFAQLLLKHRTLAKIYGTYVTGLEKWLDKNNRIHTTLKHTGTVTGRLSSADPNLQNIPRPNEDKFQIRNAFVAAKGKRLVVADYEQLEMRLMAHFSGDEKMIHAIQNGIDLHCLTVSEIYGYPYDDTIKAKKAEKKAKEVAGVDLKDWQNPELDVESPIPGTSLRDYYIMLLLLRQAAKATGFGIIYGIGGPHLAANLTRDLGKKFEPQEGNQLIKKWFSVFPGVQKYIEYVHAQVHHYGYVQTLMGRFRRFGDLKNMNKFERAQAERQSVNSIIQGSAADIAKMAMLRAESDVVLRECQADLLLQIHDELIWEIPDDDEICKQVKARVKEIMEDPFLSPLRVPLPASAGSGYTWSTAK